MNNYKMTTTSGHKFETEMNGSLNQVIEYFKQGPINIASYPEEKMEMVVNVVRVEYIKPIKDCRWCKGDGIVFENLHFSNFCECVLDQAEDEESDIEII